MSDDLLRELIDDEREALAPSADAVNAAVDPTMDATWAKISHSVANDVGPIVDPSAVGSPANAAAMTPWAKGLLVAALGGAAMGGAAYWGGTGEINDARTKVAITASEQTRSDVDAALPEREEPTMAPDLERGTPPAAPQPEAIADEMHAPVPPVTEKASGQTPPSKRPTKTESRPRETPLVPEASPELSPELNPEAVVASPKVSTLAEEARLLATARRSYKQGDYTATLASLTEHAQRFPHGQLAEDRLALRARAQCDDGKNDAGKQTAAALRKAFPASSQLARVARACTPTTAN